MASIRKVRLPGVGDANDGLEITYDREAVLKLAEAIGRQMAREDFEKLHGGDLQPVAETPLLIEPLVVRPRDACRMLSVGLTKLYDLLNAGALDSYLDCRSRRITVASIHAYIELQLAVSRRDG